MSNKENPLVSVVIPTYKRPGMLGRAIDSALNQTYENIEIIVVDDNDENSEYRKETEKFMEKYSQTENLHYIKHKKNKNGAAARNTGIRNANGKYIAFLDDDDKYLSKKIELQVMKMERLDSTWGGIYSGVKKTHQNKEFNILPKMEGNLQRELLSKEFEFGTGSNLFIKKEVILKLNGFDTSFSRHQDWEFLVRFFRKWKIAYIDKILVIKYCQDNINKPNLEELIEIKKKYLKKYKNDMKKFSLQEQNTIYYRHWITISIKYFKSNYIKKGVYYFKKANTFKKSNTILYFKIIFWIINGYMKRRKI